MKKHLGAVLATVVIALSASPAHAVVVKTDPGDDVSVLGGWEVDPALEAAGELSKVTLKPSAETFKVTFRMGAAHEGGDGETTIQQWFQIAFNGTSDSRAFELFTSEAKVRMFGPGVPQYARCQRAAIDYGARNVTITLPWTCMGDLGPGSPVASMTVRIQANLGGDFTGDQLVAKRVRLR